MINESFQRFVRKWLEGGLAEDWDAVAWINTPRWQKSSLGLSRMKALCEGLGRPQDDLRFVHVAGTNGKGSICAYMASTLRAAGYKTGLFTSPYIECFHERIQVDGVNISDDALNRVANEVRPVASAVEASEGEHPTEFELMTAVAFEYFRSVGCDIVVAEVGLGGRLDATNVIERPEVCVVGRIGLDHTEILGRNLGAVAAEKAGIIKPGSPVVSWPQQPEAMEVITQAAALAKSALLVPNFSSLAIKPLENSTVREFSYKGRMYETALLGRYQPANAAVALEALDVLSHKGWHITQEAQFQGIAQARWPGRFEVVATNPLTIVDGGHNPQGASALADSLDDLLGSHAQASVDFVMGVLADKDYPAMIQAVLRQARSFTVFAPSSPRALSAKDLASCVCSIVADAGRSLPVEQAPSPQAAMKAARRRASSQGIVVAFGSLYAIADLKDGLL